MPAKQPSTDPQQTPTYDEASLLAMIDSTLPSNIEDQLTEATVLEVGEKSVLVDTGSKSDGVISLNECKDIPNLKPGDKIEVYIESQEDRQGEHVISRKKAKKLRSWQTIVDAHATQKPLLGRVEGRVKGGMEVNINGITTFLPGSQIDNSPVTDFDALLNQSIEVIVLSIKPDKQNAVVSRRALLEKAQKALIENLQEGQVLEGIVKNITTFGVFVELAAGIVGLVYVKEIAWDKRISNPDQAQDEAGNPLFVVGEPVKVVVKGFEAQEGSFLPRIALSIKALLPNPWDQLSEEFEVGSKVQGRVTTIKERGICVEIQEGIEGFVHISEMSLSSYIQSPQELVEIGQEVTLQVLKIDREEQDLRLGMRQLMDDPWEASEFLDSYGLNTRHQAKIRRYGEKNKGVYFEIKPGVEGYLDNDHISWTKKILRANDYFKLGETHEVIVLGLNEESKLLKLGMRELEESPWDSFEATFRVGSQHEAVVKNKYRMGMLLELPYGLQAFVPNKELIKEDKVPFEEGDTLKIQIMDFIKYEHRVMVSHVATYQDPKTYVKKGGPMQALQKTTLSDLDALSKLKEKLNEKENEGKNPENTKAKDR